MPHPATGLQAGLRYTRVALLLSAPLPDLAGMAGVEPATA